MLTGAASVITHQLSLKGKAAADVAEVAKHLNITYDVRDAENAGGMRAETYCTVMKQHHMTDETNLSLLKNIITRKAPIQSGIK